ncbi:response regulator transcription factor [Fodinicola feengrottensis]
MPYAPSPWTARWKRPSTPMLSRVWTRRSSRRCISGSPSCSPTPSSMPTRPSADLRRPRRHRDRRGGRRQRSGRRQRTYRRRTGGAASPARGLRRHPGGRQSGRRSDPRENGGAMRIVVAEDLYLLRDGIVRLIEAYGHEVVATATTGPETLDALLAWQPDVAIVDVRMPPTQTDEGLRAALEARRKVPGLPVLILSQHVEQLYARELLADGAGGVGYFLKESVFDADQFMDALTRVSGGGTAMDSAVITKLFASGTSNRRLGSLTEREQSVLSLMAEGLSNQAVAQRLFLSESAISKYTTSIFGKLGITDDDNNNRRVLAVLSYLNKP